MVEFDLEDEKDDIVVLFLVPRGISFSINFPWMMFECFDRPIATKEEQQTAQIDCISDGSRSFFEKAIPSMIF